MTRYAVSIEGEAGSYHAYVPDLPAASQPETPGKKFEALMAEAIRLHVASLRSQGNRLEGTTEEDRVTAVGSHWRSSAIRDGNSGESRRAMVVAFQLLSVPDTGVNPTFAGPEIVMVAVLPAASLCVTVNVGLGEPLVVYEPVDGVVNVKWLASAPAMDTVSVRPGAAYRAAFP
jgi:predicted RNase H-like HicB family nuclease